MRTLLLAEHPEVRPLIDGRPQRLRLMDAMITAVADSGYDQASVAVAVRLARVSRTTFYELFASKEDCLLAAYRTGYEVLEHRIDEAISGVSDWRERLRLGFRAYLETLQSDPLFARVFLIEAHVIFGERERVLNRFAERYARTFARSGREAPPADALVLLAAGVHELACARVRAGDDVRKLEETLMSCALRLAGDTDESWS